MTLQPEILVKTVAIPDTNVSVELYLVDFPGHDAFQASFLQTAYGAHSFVLCFDSTCMESFKALPKWIAALKKSRTVKGSFSGVLLATKVDASPRVVSAHQAQEFARHNGLGYFECSALNNVEVDSPFYFLSSTFHEIFEEHLKSFTKLDSTGV
jgi:transport family protein 27